MGRNRVVTIFLILMILVSSLVVMPRDASALTPHNPIYISGNFNFSPPNGVTGGSGTPSDPYIIEGWEINASSDHGIEIRFTDVHFVIRNVHIHSGNSTSMSGIVLNNVANALVENVTAWDNNIGIYLSYSTNVSIVGAELTDNGGRGVGFVHSSNSTVSSSTISRNRGEGLHLASQSDNNTFIDNAVEDNELDGIPLGFSHNNTFVNNTISSNGRYGIHFFRSRNITMISNVMAENGIHIFGLDVEDWNTHSIDISNAVNGKTVYYWKNLLGGTVPADAGQVILANCTDITVENQNVSNASVGIELGFSSGNVVADNTASFNQHGISLYRSDQNTITGNTALTNQWEGIVLELSNNNTLSGNNASLDNNQGIQLIRSDNNTITDNVAIRNSWHGIYSGINIFDSTGNEVTGNFLYRNDFGIRLSNTVGNLVQENNASINYNWGIMAGGSGDTIKNNTLIGNYLDAIYVTHSTNNTISGNIMEENGIYIYSPDFEDWNTHEIDTSNLVHGKPVRYWKNAIGGTVPTGAGQVILANCTGVTVENQNTSSGSTGIELGFSWDNTIVNNTAITNDIGISVHYSSGNRIDGNAFIDGGRGVKLHFSSGHTITRNLVVSNTYGIGLFSSTGNIIHHNGFIDNFGQAHDDTGGNYWNDPYPSGGNHWSDYSGTDAFSGPGQDLPGSDGIGDTPYAIDGESDNYPLMEPFPSEPSAPQNLVALAGDGHVSLTWEAPASDGGFPIANYTIYRGLAPGQESVLAETGDVLFFDDTDVSNGMIYYYKVTAKNRLGESELSDEASGRPLGLPSPPPSVQAQPSDSRVVLIWTPPTDDGGSTVTGYRVYRGLTGDDLSFYHEVGDIQQWIDFNATNGITYYYAIGAVNGAGEGEQSGLANATPFNTLPTCNISFPQSGAIVSGSVTVTGGAADTDGTVWRVEVRIDDGSWIAVMGTDSWSYDWNTTSVYDGSRKIRVRSFDGKDYSGESTVTVTVNNGISSPPKEESVFSQAWFWAIIAIIIVVPLILFIILWRRKLRRDEPPHSS